MILYKKLLVFLLSASFSLMMAQGALACWGEDSLFVTPTTPSEDFTLHDDGTVTHKKTGLMWMRCPAGQVWDEGICTEDFQLYDWQQALQAADGQTFAGYSDWRLPNKNELASLVERKCYNAAINTEVFPFVLVNETMPFLSSSLTQSMYGVNGTVGIWMIDFIDGSIYYAIASNNTLGFARFVRDIQ